jgi:hypothetical protein
MVAAFLCLVVDVFGPAAIVSAVRFQAPDDNASRFFVA